MDNTPDYPHNTPDFGPLSSNRFDVIIIGAGVVGCAMARRFTLEGARVLVLEKGADILDGASKGNSAILHTGFDAPTGSLEHACMVNGYHEYLDIRKSLQLPLLETGALVLAWTDEELGKLDEIVEQAHSNGIDDAQLLSGKAVLSREPRLSNHVQGGVAIPREYVIDPWTAPHTYLLQALRNGAQLIRRCAVSGGRFEGDHWILHTSQGTVRADFVINCAGLYGDHVDQRLLGRSPFRIKPRKGQFLVYDKPASRLIQSIILPVPTNVTKGVVICRTIFGNLLVGPTAQEQDSRDDASVDTTVLEALRRTGERLLPALAGQSITATYAGIRPATQFKDYCIESYGNRHYISVGGIRSTGLTAALGIARHVFDSYTTLGYHHTPDPQPLCPSVTPIAEHEARDWQQDGNGGIVCHCEWVTRREIEAALSGDLPARSLDGLKRRTRVTMGRCQGFYCTAQLSELTQGRFDDDLAVGSVND